jgi:hypothetical protein
LAVHSPAAGPGVTVDASDTDMNMRPNQLQEIVMEEVDNFHVESSSFNQSRDTPQVCSQDLHIGPGISINCSQEPSFINEEASLNQKRDVEQLQGGLNSYAIYESITSTNDEPSTSHRRNNLVLHGMGPTRLPRLVGGGNALEEYDMVVDDEPSPLNNRIGSEKMKEASMNQKRDVEQLQGGINPYAIDESITGTNDEFSTSHRRNNLVLHGMTPMRLPRLVGGGNALEENGMVIDDKPSPLNNRIGSERMKHRNTLVNYRSIAKGKSYMAVDDEADNVIMDSINDDSREDKLELKNSPFTYLSSLQAQWAEESRTNSFIRGRIKVRITRFFFCS